MKTAVSADRLREEIIAIANQHPDGKNLEMSDIAILGAPGSGWSASFHHDGPAMAPACAFQALTLVQNTFDLAKTKLSKREIADKILQEINVGGCDLGIMRATDGRWVATVRARPAAVKVEALQSIVESVADRLRLQYDLDD